MVPVDPGERLVDDPVVGVLDARPGPAGPVRVLLLRDVAQGHALLVPVEERRVVVVGVPLVEVAEERVEAHAARVAGRAGLAEAPLAEESGRVAGVAEEVSDRPLARAQRLDVDPVPAGVAADAHVAHVAAGHEDGARRRADRRARVEVGEAEALGREAVDARRADELLAVGAHVSVAEVVGDDEDDVGARGRRGGVPAHHGQPVLGREGRRGAEGHLLAPLDRAHRAGAEPPAAARVEPGDGKPPRRVAEVELGRPAPGQVDEVDLALLREGVARVVLGRVADERVFGLHLPERDALLLEETERDRGVVPRPLAAAPVLAEEVVLGERVAEVVLDPGAPGEERAPQGVTPHVVPVVLAPASLPRLPGEAREALVRGHAERGVALLVVRDHPGPARARRLAPPLQHPLVRRVPVVLQRRPAEARGRPEERRVDEVLVAGVGVDHDRVVVGVELAQGRGHRPLLLGGLRVLLAEVPVEGEEVGEAGDQLAVVEPPLHAHRSAVEGLGHAARRPLVRQALVVVLRLLGLEVQEEAERLRVLEDDAPLVELRAVVVERRAAIDERPDVVPVAPGVVGEERHGVHPAAGEVAERPDQALAHSALPGRVARPPVAHVGRPGLERPLLLGRRRSVEVGVGEEGLGGVRPGLEEVPPRPREAEVVTADVGQPALGAEVAAGLVRGLDLEGARGAVDPGHRLARRRRVDRDPRAAHHRGAPRPAARPVGGDVRPPLRPRLGRGLAGVAVRGEVPGHVVRGRAGLVGEAHGEPVVEERVGGGVPLACEGAVERERHRVPLPELAGHGGGSGGRGRRAGGAQPCDRHERRSRGHGEQRSRPPRRLAVGGAAALDDEAQGAGAPHVDEEQHGLAAVADRPAVGLLDAVREHLEAGRGEARVGGGARGVVEQADDGHEAVGVPPELDLDLPVRDAGNAPRPADPAHRERRLRGRDGRRAAGGEQGVEGVRARREARAVQPRHGLQRLGEGDRARDALARLHEGRGARARAQGPGLRREQHERARPGGVPASPLRDLDREGERPGPGEVGFEELRGVSPSHRPALRHDPSVHLHHVSQGRGARLTAGGFVGDAHEGEEANGLSVQGHAPLARCGDADAPRVQDAPEDDGVSAHRASRARQARARGRRREVELLEPDRVGRGVLAPQDPRVHVLRGERRREEQGEAKSEGGLHGSSGFGRARATLGRAMIQEAP